MTQLRLCGFGFSRTIFRRMLLGFIAVISALMAYSGAGIYELVG
jgi:DNA-directed RNA polymerase subunit N (RpoN/RPB10)